VVACAPARPWLPDRVSHRTVRRRAQCQCTGESTREQHRYTIARRCGEQRRSRTTIIIIGNTRTSGDSASCTSVCVRVCVWSKTRSVSRGGAPEGGSASGGQCCGSGGIFVTLGLVVFVCLSGRVYVFVSVLWSSVIQLIAEGGRIVCLACLLLWCLLVCASVCVCVLCDRCVYSVASFVISLPKVSRTYMCLF
jgi:hypothetical protein